MSIPLPKKYQNSAIEWKRPCEISSNNAIFSKYYANGEHFLRRFDILSTDNQMLSSCVTGLTWNISVFEDIIPINHKLNTDNDKLIFKLYDKKGDRVTVEIDDKLPILDGILICGQAVDNVYWYGLLEKSLAKLIGGYDKLIDMKITDIITHLTGIQSKIITEEKELKEILMNQGIVCCQKGRKEWDTVTGWNRMDGRYRVKMNGIEMEEWMDWDDMIADYNSIITAKYPDKEIKTQNQPRRMETDLMTFPASSFELPGMSSIGIIADPLSTFPEAGLPSFIRSPIPKNGPLRNMDSSTGGLFDGR